MVPYYKNGKVTLYQGDSVNLLSELKNYFDLLVTDPPYYLSNLGSDANKKINPWQDMVNSSGFYASWFKQALHLADAMFVCMNWRSLPVMQKASYETGFKMESLMVWDKKHMGLGGLKGFRASFEMVGYWWNGRKIINRSLRDVQQFPWSSTRRTGHPAEKPVRGLEKTKLEDLT